MKCQEFRFGKGQPLPEAHIAWGYIPFCRSSRRHTLVANAGKRDAWPLVGWSLTLRGYKRVFSGGSFAAESSGFFGSSRLTTIKITAVTMPRMTSAISL